MVTIYRIVCPVTRRTKYIGKTKNDLAIRLNAHILQGYWVWGQKYLKKKYNDITKVRKFV